MEDQQCPIWGTQCQSITPAENSVIVTDSPRAGGSYQLYDDATAELGNLTDDEKARLTTALVRERLLGNPCPSINAATTSAAKSANRARMEDRLTNLLRVLIDRTPKVGEPVGVEGPEGPAENVRSYQFALAYTESTEHQEISYLADSLHDSRAHTKTRHTCTLRPWTNKSHPRIRLYGHDAWPLCHRTTPDRGQVGPVLCRNVVQRGNRRPIRQGHRACGEGSRLPAATYRPKTGLFGQNRRPNHC